MTYKEALAIIAGFAFTSKTGISWGIPAQKCKTGSKLRKVKNSVCSKCYALKGRYVFGNVKKSLERKFEALKNPMFVKAFIFAVKVKSPQYLRFFDSGDIQSLEHLDKFVQIAKSTPEVKYWLPTKEWRPNGGPACLVSEYIRKFGAFPANLCVRLSAFIIDLPGPTALAARLGVTTSTVTSKGDFTCPASRQGNQCLDCRKCWDKNVPNISYPLH